MKLINVEGLAFIGPGSEWFWTAVSGFVLAVTFIAIYRQLRLQADVAAVEQAAGLQRDWQSERLAQSRVTVLLALRDGTDPANLPPGAATAIGQFWERVGYLVRAGHVDRQVINEIFTGVGVWWTLLAAFTSRERTAQGDPRIGENFEWLAGILDEMARRSGAPAMDDSRRTSWMERQILANVETIRAAEELRAVIVRPTSTARLTPEAAATSSPA
jgi:hypothetical protein